MKVIKFFVYFIIVLAVFVFLVAPPLIGLYAKHQYYSMIENASKKNPNVTMKISSYQFGWFSSKITTEIDLHMTPKNDHKPLSSDNNVRVMIYVNMHHGPVIYSAYVGKKRFYLALADIKGKIPTLNLNVHSIWHFSNTITSAFSSPGFELTVAPTTVSVKNFQGTSNYHVGSHRFQVHSTLDAMSVYTNQNHSMSSNPTIRLDGLLYVADIDQKGLINYGKQKLAINKVLLNFDQKNPVTLNNLSAASNTTLNDGKIDITVTYNIQSISKNPLGINGFQLDFAIKNVNADSLNELLEALSQQNQQPVDYKTLLTPGMDLLRKGVSIHINYFYLKTDGGSVSLDGTFAIPELPKNTSFLQVPMMMKADCHFQAPKTWLKQQMASFIGFFQPPKHGQTQVDPNEAAMLTLQQWENQNLLISSGKNYTAQIQFQNGHLLINGKVPNLQKHPAPNPQYQQNQLNSKQPRTDAQ